MLPPLASARGRARGSDPERCSAVTVLMVTARVAVIVTAPLPVAPTAAVPRSVLVAPTAEVVGAPKPRTCPSLVPTKTRPLSVATEENLAAVPSGAVNTCWSLPLLSGRAR